MTALLRAAGPLFLGLLLATDLLGAAPDGISLADVQKAADPAVCLVTVQNSLGLDIGYATGFVMGTGRFVITDLAVLAQSDAARAVLRFQDGSTLTTTQFGLANPSIGLAAIYLGDTSTRTGLTLASGPARPLPLPATLFGWRWGDRLTVVVGRLVSGPESAELASRLGVGAPADAWGFLYFTGGTLPGASGAPILDREGSVLGIALLLTNRNTTLLTVVPSDVMRQALLAAKPELKPFSDLPKPLWPSEPLRITGEPPTAAEFAKSVEATQASFICPRCHGKGVISVDGNQRTCPSCHREKVLCSPTTLTQLTDFAGKGTRLDHLWETDDRTHRALRAAAAGISQTLLQAPERFQHAFTHASQMTSSRTTLPKGLVVYAQVSGFLKAADAEYTLLIPAQGGSNLAIRSDVLLAAASEKVETGPQKGDWILLIGLALQTFTAEGGQRVYVMPFQWTTAPALGDAPLPNTPPPRDPPPRPSSGGNYQRGGGRRR